MQRLNNNHSLRIFYFSIALLLFSGCAFISTDYTGKPVAIFFVENLTSDTCYIHYQLKNDNDTAMRISICPPDALQYIDSLHYYALWLDTTKARVEDQEKYVEFVLSDLLSFDKKKKELEDLKEFYEKRTKPSETYEQFYVLAKNDPISNDSLTIRFDTLLNLTPLNLRDSLDTESSYLTMNDSIWTYHIEDFPAENINVNWLLQIGASK